MFPDTFQAALVTVLLVLPGALYTWGIERVTGHWGVGLADRALRFIGISACFHVVLAPLTYHSYRFYLRAGAVGGASLPLEFWLTLLVYVLGPPLAGLLVGHGLQRRSRLAEAVAGRHRAPRAWDAVFTLGKIGYVRLRLKGAGQDSWAGWLAGWYGPDRGSRRTTSYGGRYPAAQDLYLANTFVCDQRTGELVERDGHPIPLRQGLLIRWDEVSYLQFTSIGRPGR